MKLSEILFIFAVAALRGFWTPALLQDLARALGYAPPAYWATLLAVFAWNLLQEEIRLSEHRPKYEPGDYWLIGFIRLGLMGVAWLLIRAMS